MIEKQTTGRERAAARLSFIKEWQAKTYVPMSKKPESRQVKRRDNRSAMKFAQRRAARLALWGRNKAGKTL